MDEVCQLQVRSSRSSVLTQAINGEQCAIQVYSSLAEITQGKDIVTYDLASQILADEVEHEEDLQSLLEDIEGMIGRVERDTTRHNR
jgi:bacterioferritin